MKYIKVKTENYITAITIDREKQLNALNDELMHELKDAIGAIDREETRCVLITGAGEKSFVAGADIGQMHKLNPVTAKLFSDFGNGVYRDIENLPMPVIAVINGYCLGGGEELTLACDIRLASENAIFGQPEVGLGIMAGYGGTQRLAKIVGYPKAAEIMYTADKIDASEALKIGLVNHVYKKEELMDKAIEMAKKITGNAPIAVAATKEAMKRGEQADIDTGIHYEASIFARLFSTKDRENAMQAFLDKKKADKFINE